MKIFDLEQQIQECWTIVDDIKMINTLYKEEDNSSLNEALNSLAVLYGLKFQTMWNTFEKVCDEYHSKNINHNAIDVDLDVGIPSEGC